jgi:DNA polymerase-4
LVISGIPANIPEIPIEMMHTLLGETGSEIWRRADGIDETPVVLYH